MDAKKDKSQQIDKGEKVSVTSYNQSGGITANHVTIENPGRILSDEFKPVLLNVVEVGFGKYNFDKKSIISIFVPGGDQEARRYAIQIKEYLLSQGYNVYPDFSPYMGNVGMGKRDIMFTPDTIRKQMKIFINYKDR